MAAVRGPSAFFAAFAILSCCVSTSGGALAEEVKIGLLKSATSPAPIYVAIENGTFAAEGITASLVRFDGPQPIPVAVASGDVDVGVVGLTGAFYALAGAGALHIVAGAFHSVPGFNSDAFIVSNRAYAAGLRSVSDLPGHSFGVSVTGSPAHYMLGLLAEKHAFDLQSVRLLPLHAIPNIISALVGGQVDASVVPSSIALPVIERADAKLLLWVGDETPWQVNAVFVTRRTADERHDLVERFLRAYRKGVREYHDAVTGPGEVRQDGPTANAILPIIAKYAGITVDEARNTAVYFDAEARLDVNDVLRQIAWYRSHNFVKGEVDGDAIIDKRYVMALPER